MTTRKRKASSTKTDGKGEPAKKKAKSPAVLAKKEWAKTRLSEVTLFVAQTGANGLVVRSPLNDVDYDHESTGLGGKGAVSVLARELRIDTCYKLEAGETFRIEILNDVDRAEFTAPDLAHFPFFARRSTLTAAGVLICLDFETTGNAVYLVSVNLELSSEFKVKKEKTKAKAVSGKEEKKDEKKEEKKEEAKKIAWREIENLEDIRIRIGPQGFRCAANREDDNLVISRYYRMTPTEPFTIYFDLDNKFFDAVEAVAPVQEQDDVRVASSHWMSLGLVDVRGSFKFGAPGYVYLTRLDVDLTAVLRDRAGAPVAAAAAAVDREDVRMTFGQPKLMSGHLVLQCDIGTCFNCETPDKPLVYEICGHRVCMPCRERSIGLIGKKGLILLHDKAEQKLPHNFDKLNPYNHQEAAPMFKEIVAQLKPEKKEFQPRNMLALVCEGWSRCTTTTRISPTTTAFACPSAGGPSATTRTANV